MTALVLSSHESFCTMRAFLLSCHESFCIMTVLDESFSTLSSYESCRFELLYYDSFG